MAIVDELMGQTRDWLVGHREKDLPRPRLTPALAAKWMFDEWTLQVESAQSRVRLPSGNLRRRLRNELGDGVEMFNDRGWVDDPRSYHVDPPPLSDPAMLDRRALGIDYEHLTFDSGYEPHTDEPGRDRWLSYTDNRVAHAWVMRHPDGPRPWLVCINGYRTGNPRIDFPAFRARYLHETLGLNLAFPVQPLHGPRAEGMSGDKVLFDGAMNTVHTAAQGLWDIRRLISWIRDTQEPTSIGAMGLSLGGYLTALTASFEGDLSCAIAGIPEADLVRGMRRQVEPLLPPFYEQWGLSWRSLERVNRVVSPLALEPLVPREARFIFAGLVDRWVRPGNVRALWDHWDRPSICWYDGGHLSFLVEPEVRLFIDEALTHRLAEVPA